MPITYDNIATTTISSATSSITFSSIPNTYTDLRIVLTLVAGATQYMQMDFNGDTGGTNFSETWIDSSGTAIATSKTTNQSFIDLSQRTASSGSVTFYAIDILGYRGSTLKTCLLESNQDANGSGFVGRIVGLWRSTSAITTVRLFSSANIYGVGTVATLYGIKNA
jgi:hypothetical protein